MNLVETVPILMNTNHHILDREEVICFLTNQCENSRIICKELKDTTMCSEELLKNLYDCDWRYLRVIQGAAAKVMMLDKTGWHRGTVRLELVFYPDKETADTNV
ncbi:hypothetical protein [uncultured Thermosynechococcus sp.]|uniref:hypothetical protein n=1 Tax=uncultured Thermosynechococcus sp. TaxID=436945 RepID=UPI0026245A7A|nr:hypothetical protein [uncultured Thermosynechococcus sp.]